MKITYDNHDICKVSIRRDTIKKAVSMINATDVSKIRSIHIGYNKATTQEARIVQRGDIYDIRINCQTSNGLSKYSEMAKRNASIILKIGGTIDTSTNRIEWLPDVAQKYHLFLLLHEIAHIVFTNKFSDGSFSKKTSPQEEAWCDAFALDTLMKLWPLVS